MRIAIVGAGALGLYYGALLQRNGEDIHFLLRSDFDAISKRGLKILSINGDFVLPHVQCYRRSEEIGTVDLILVGLKTFSNDHYTQLITPLIGERTQILTLQNGLGNEETLAALFGRERIFGGVAFLCSNRGTPGEVHHLGAGRMVLGEYQRCDRDRVNRLVTIFSNAGLDCRATDDLKRTRWEKLVWNIPFNGLCALMQEPVDFFLTPGPNRQLVREIMLEVIAAANVQEILRPIPESYAENMLEFTDTMGAYRPSMQIDRKEGRQLEMASIFGAPLDYGRKKGIKMPRVEMLATLLEQSMLPPFT